MKIKMISLESGDAVLEVEGKTVSECTANLITAHTEEFGEDYLSELLNSLSELLNENGDHYGDYTRIEFSDPEANYQLILIKDLKEWVK